MSSIGMEEFVGNQKRLSVPDIPISVLSSGMNNF